MLARDDELRVGEAEGCGTNNVRSLIVEPWMIARNAIKGVDCSGLASSSFAFTVPTYLPSATPDVATAILRSTVRHDTQTSPVT